jgi:hypothetical protein
MSSAHVSSNRDAAYSPSLPNCWHFLTNTGLVCAKKMFDSDRKDSIQKMLRKGWVCQTGELHILVLISYEKREKSAAKGAMTLPS